MLVKKSSEVKVASRTIQHSRILNLYNYVITVVTYSSHVSGVANFIFASSIVQYLTYVALSDDESSHLLLRPKHNEVDEFLATSARAFRA